MVRPLSDEHETAVREGPLRRPTVDTPALVPHEIDPDRLEAPGWVRHVALLLGSVSVVAVIGVGVSVHRYLDFQLLRCPEPDQVVAGQAPPVGDRLYCQVLQADGTWVKDGPEVVYRRAASRLSMGRVLPVIAAEGHHERGLRHGAFVEYSARHPSVKVRERHFERGLQQGLEVERSPSGALLREAHYQDGELHGPVREYFGGPAYLPPVLRHEGGYNHGKRQGTFVDYDLEGRIAERRVFVDDRPHGPYERFEGGEWVERATYVDGRREGQVQTRDPRTDTVATEVTRGGLVSGPYERQVAGVVRERGTLRQRDLDTPPAREGRWTIFGPAGEKIAEGRFEDGQETGRWVAWHERAAVAATGNTGEARVQRAVGSYRRGKRHGKWLEWHPDGSRAFVGAYRDGQAHGRHRRYHPGGALAFDGRFDHGLEVGPHTRYDEAGRVRFSRDFGGLDDEEAPAATAAPPSRKPGSLLQALQARRR